VAVEGGERKTATKRMREVRKRKEREGEQGRPALKCRTLRGGVAESREGASRRDNTERGEKTGALFSLSWFS
jgi:hypothetical protein